MERWLLGIPIILISIVVGRMYAKIKFLEEVLEAVFGLANALKAQHDECDKIVNLSKEQVDNVDKTYGLIIEQYDSVMAQYENVMSKMKAIDALLGDK